MLFFLSPGLLLFVGTSFVLAVNEERTLPEWIVWGACALLCGANGGFVAVRAVRRFLWARRAALLMAAIVTIISLAAAEGALQRFMVPAPITTEGSIHQSDLLLGYTHRPSSTCHHVLPRVFDVTYHLDANGLRRAPDSPTPSSDARLVLALGCSQTFGHGLADADAWPAQLEAVLGREWGVLNAGVAAYGPQQMLLRGRQLSAELHPDIILVGLASFHRLRFGNHPSHNAMIGDFGLRIPVLERMADGTIGVARLVPEEVPDRDEITLFHNEQNTAPRRFEIQLTALAKRFAVGNAIAFTRWMRGERVPVEDFNGDDEANWRLIMEAFGELEQTSGARVIALLLPEPSELKKSSYQQFADVVAAAGAEHGVEVWDTNADVAALMGWHGVALHPVYELHYTPRTAAALAAVVAMRLGETRRATSAAAATD
jgi:hypothetical protein